MERPRSKPQWWQNSNILQTNFLKHYLPDVKRKQKLKIIFRSKFGGDPLMSPLRTWPRIILTTPTLPRMNGNIIENMKRLTSICTKGTRTSLQRKRCQWPSHWSWRSSELFRTGTTSSSLRSRCPGSPIVPGSVDETLLAGWQEDHHCRPWQLSPWCGQAPGQHVRRGHHGAQLAHRHPLRLRARREHEAACLDEVPWRWGNSQEGHRVCCSSGMTMIQYWVLLSEGGKIPPKTESDVWRFNSTFHFFPYLRVFGVGLAEKRPPTKKVTDIHLWKF